MLLKKYIYARRPIRKLYFEKQAVANPCSYKIFTLNLIKYPPLNIQTAFFLTNAYTIIIVGVHRSCKKGMFENVKVQHM